MSNGRYLSPAQSAVAHLLGPLTGARIAGGCEECNAYQSVEAVMPGVWVNTIHHDDDCPVLLAYEAKA